MASLHLGPDGLLLLYALFIPVVHVSIGARDLPPLRVGLSTIAVSIMLAIVQHASIPRVNLAHEALNASFIIVPTILLVLASQLAVFKARTILLLPLSPVIFAATYFAIRLVA